MTEMVDFESFLSFLMDSLLRGEEGRKGESYYIWKLPSELRWGEGGYGDISAVRRSVVQVQERKE